MKKSPSLKLLGTAYRADQLIKLSGPVALFIGRSNVGKSSLLNAITGKSLAQVSKTPGKTRSVNYYRYGPRLILVDLPGYGFAKRSKAERMRWAHLMRVFFDGLPAVILAYILMDAKRDPEEEELSLVESLGTEKTRVIFLLTKADRLDRKAREKRQKSMEILCRDLRVEGLWSWNFISVKTGEGIQDIRRDLHQFGRVSKS